MKLFNGVKAAAEKTRAMGQTTSRRAQIAVWEREMRARKHEFGVELFEVMERNRNIGEQTGGEVEPAVVQVFQDTVTDILLLLERRKKKHTTLVKTSNPKALCYQNAGEPSESERSVTESIDDDSERSAVSASSTGSNNSSRAEAFEQSMRQGLFRARSTLQATQNKAKLKLELDALDKEIYQCKQKFGITMYDTMDALGKDFEPKDPSIRELYAAAKKDIDLPLSKMIKASKEICDVQTSGAIQVSHDEIKEYVEANPNLWAMLGVNIGITDERCKEVAVRVAIELCVGEQGAQAKKIGITKQQFIQFEKKYVQDPKGSQEFFHRSVYDAFDTDGNGILDKEETDKFLDTFYMTGSIFEGDDRLPEKEDLKKLILEKLDENGDGEFSFEEIRSLISGSAARGDLL